MDSLDGRPAGGPSPDGRLSAESPPELYFPRKRRLLLAVYLDYLIFGAPWALLMWSLEPLLPEHLARGGGLGKLIVFMALEAFVLYRVRWSPGNRILGIRIHTPSQLASGAEGAIAGRAFTVPAQLMARETWWTMLFGVLCILDGSKSLVRWTMFAPPMPFMGVQLDERWSAALYVASGLLLWAVGVGVLQVRIYAVPLGLLYFGGGLASTLLSWPLWPPYTATYITARRAYQGRSVSPGEVEMAQSLMPQLVLAGVACLLIYFFFVSIRIWRTRR